MKSPWQSKEKKKKRLKESKSHPPPPLPQGGRMWLESHGREGGRLKTNLVGVPWGTFLKFEYGYEILNPNMSPNIDHLGTLVCHRV